MNPKDHIMIIAAWSLVAIVVAMLIMSFYFGGRTLEKIIDMKSKEK